ncbi:hypothetical protein [Roseibium sp. RKSG952]|uniref:hypothetical protein n=1 Tax=Roseibium sp. RKSG952 TaxID=2529384 RepID=UPI0012BB8682|nr:hypothetical protein [Roseibium sp. RKSG952]MTH97685.1 hypothetical protein [Roseibium sp. RKSG952]
MNDNLDRVSRLHSAIARLAGLPGISQKLTCAAAHGILAARFHEFADLRPGAEPIDAAWIEAVFPGNTIFGAPCDNDPYILSFYPDGAGRMKIMGRNAENGRWWLDRQQNILHSRWAHSAAGRDIAVRYYRTPDPGIYLHEAANRPLPQSNWRICVVRPGLAL